MNNDGLGADRRFLTALTRRFANHHRKSKSEVRQYSYRGKPIYVWKYGAWFGELPSGWSMEYLDFKSKSFEHNAVIGFWFPAENLGEYQVEKFELLKFSSGSQTVYLDSTLLKQVRVPWLRKAKLYVNPSLSVKFSVEDEFLVVPGVRIDKSAEVVAR